MQLDSRNTINSIVTTMLPRMSEEAIFQAIMIQVRISYMEHISDCGEKEIDPLIRNQTLEQLKGTEVRLVEDRYFESNVTHNFLFCNTHGGYSCFYNPEPFVQGKKQSFWEFQSNHDSCWRDDAHHSARIRDNMIRTTLSNMMTFHNKKGIEQYSPGMIVSNFSNLEINQYTIARFSTDRINGDYTKLGSKWELVQSDGKISLSACKA